MSEDRDPTAPGSVSLAGQPPGEAGSQAAAAPAVPEEAADVGREAFDALQDRHLRLAAEFENFRKRMAREQLERERRAGADLLLELLEIVDNFERALVAEHEDSAYARGVALIRDQLLGLLARRGVERLQVDGRKFDPEVHEALLHIPSDVVPNGHICQDLRSGYLLHGRTLRPAQVAVSSGTGSPAPAAGTEPED